MSAVTDPRSTLPAALLYFQTLPLKDAARQLLAKLGYQSDKFLVGAGSKPQDFLDHFAAGHSFDQAKALVPDWKSADLLFQLTDEELQATLFKEKSVQRGLLKSYVFIAIELKGRDYARGKFSAIARQINRLFPMPVMVVFKHGERLTIAVINRRRNKIDDSKDVLEKATLIRDITFAQPHRGHLDILASLVLADLKHPQKKPITDFDTLHAAWEQIFNVELLNERFYRELANWYFWALPQVQFPADLEPDDEKRRATGLIRLLTRLIFCWFLKEKNLIPEKLFHPADLAKLLKGFDPESETSSTYYQAILQNLFFATLNQRMGKDGNGKPYRIFATDEGFAKNRATYDVNNLYRYEALFRDEPDAALAHFADIPFLNGGLFECLDRTEDGTDKKRYLDGFSRNAKKRPHVPDRLFFDSGETADLSTAYGDTKRKAERVTGLITILNRYKFTIVENTPIDQEIALDPELLGKVFENLLASYNEETKTTARKQTGSFYTPRPIVDYMVDESLKAHLTRALVEKARMKEPDARAGLDLLFAYTEKEHAFTPAEGQHHWLELDNNPSEDFIAAFETPKIVIADIGKYLKASWSEPKYFIGNTGYIIANAEQSTLAVLLGNVTDWYARMTFQGLGDPWEGGRMRFIKRNLVTIPIPPASAADKAKLTRLAERAAKAATEGDTGAVALIEREINEIVYRLFDLTAAEIAQIETALANTRGSAATDEADDDE